MLSIIVPCYKVEKYLPKCLDSLMSQTLKEIEVICINDGSPDGCLEILKKYKKEYDDKIVIIDKKNEGVWKGRLDGIKIARGEYIGFVDSDDWVRPEFAEKLVKAAKENNADCAVCGYDRVDLDTGKLYSREMTKPKRTILNVGENPGALLEINGAPWNKIFRAEILKNIPKLKNIPPVLDDMMFLQLAYLGTNKIAFVPDSLNVYMVRKDSIINTVKEELIAPTYASMKEIRDIYEKEKPEMLEYVDANAFLHLGISFLYRLSENKDVNFSKILANNTKFLDNEFPSWRKNKYITMKYIIRNKGVNSKLWVVRRFYKVHGFKLFLMAYKTMIDKFHVDIKW